MASPATITSLQDIQKRKSEIQEELATSKDAAVKSLSVASGEAKQFIFRDVILPAAGVALAGYLIVKTVGYLINDQEEQEQPQSAPVIPAQTTLSPNNPQPRRTVVQPIVPRRPLWQSLLRAGSILVPAGKAIAEVVQDARKDQ